MNEKIVISRENVQCDCEDFHRFPIGRLVATALTSWLDVIMYKTETREGRVKRNVSQVNTKTVECVLSFNRLNYFFFVKEYKFTKYLLFLKNI